MTRTNKIGDRLTNVCAKWAFDIGLFLVPALYLASAASSINLGDDAGAGIISLCATSFFLAALLRNAKKKWNAIIFCAMIGDIAAHLIMNTPTLAIPGIVFSDIFEVLFTAIIFNQINVGANWYLSVKTVLSLTIVSLLASVMSTLFEFSWISIFVNTSYQPYIKARSFTEALDLLVALPLALSWTDPTLLRNLSVQKIFQIIALAAATAVASYLLLASGTPFLFLAIPLPLLATLVGGLLGSTAAVFSLSLVVRWLTFDGPARIISPTGAESAGLLVIYHLFVITALLSAIPLGVLLARIENSSDRLKEAGIAAEQALQQAEAARDRAESAGKAKGEFLSVMSHELRTPMTGVLGLVDLLSKEPLNQKQRQYLGHIREAGQHLLSVINDILDFSKIDSGKLEIEAVQFSVAAVFYSVCSTTRPLCQAKGVEFIQEFDPSMPDLVIGDSTRTRQILLNLVGNAIKFTDHGSVKIIALNRSNGDGDIRLRFEVHDTGIGISNEKQPEIFAAFTQEDRSTARRYGGSGLGLAICRRLATAMGGEIDFESSSGFGSVFWFEVPVLRASREESPTPIKICKTNRRSLRILVAEDVALNRSIIRSMLSMDQHTLVFAQTGTEAVEWAKRGNFDVILMDVQMPVMDGVQATQQIRGLASPIRNVPIIALTANVLESERTRYIEAGMNLCIGKPIDWDALIEAIAQCTLDDRVMVDSAAAMDINISKNSLLLDSAKLHTIKVKLGAEIETLISQALEHTERVITDIESGKLVGENKIKEMHALKGMCGMLGLAGVQRLSGELEVEFGYGDGAKSEALELIEVVQATKVALIHQGFLPRQN